MTTNYVAIVERERKRYEFALHLRLLTTYGLAARHAMAAAKLGHNPVDAAVRVLIGDDEIGQPGLAAGVDRILHIAHAAGWKRAGLTAGLPANHAYFSAEELSLSRESDVASFAGSRAALTEIARNYARNAAAAVREGLGNAIAGASEGIKGKLAAVRGWWRKSGLTASNHPDAAKPAKATAVTLALTAYNAGADAGYEAEAGVLVSGYIFTAVIDERTTSTCRGIDGVRLAKEHIFWRGRHPPLHHNCRSILAPIMGEFFPTPAEKIPWSITAADGFGSWSFMSSAFK